MLLSQRQEKMVTAFLRQANQNMEGLAANDRARKLAEVKTRLRRELSGLGEGELRDEEVAAVMRRFGIVQNRGKVAVRGAGASRPPSKITIQGPMPPENRGVGRAAPKPKPRVEPRAPAAPIPTGLASDQRMWLGVAEALSEKLGVETYYCRLLFVLLGVVTGPIALIAYLGIYLELYVFSRDEGAPEIDRRRLSSLALKTVAGIVALYGGAEGLAYVTAALYERFLGKALLLDSWGWLAYYQESALFGMIFLCLPVVVLSGMPLPNAWDRTGTRVVQAGIALYAVFLSAGVASHLTGVLLRIVDELA